MTTWPDIQGPSTLMERSRKKQLKSDFEAGYVQSRPQWTRTRREFELGWSSMPAADKAMLEAFFANNVGGTFDWQHPGGTVYTVRFADNEIEFKHRAVNRWRCSLMLEEA